jgi:hypothetical protein
MLVEDNDTMLVNDKLWDKTIKMEFAKTAYIPFTNNMSVGQVTADQWGSVALRMLRSVRMKNVNM